MKITLNNRPDSFDQNELTIAEILKIKKYSFKLMVIKINGRLIKKTDYQNAKVVDGDDLQVIHMISGG